MNRLRFLAVWALSGALLGGLLWLMQPAPVVDAQGGVTNFDNVVISGDLTVGDDVTIADNLTVGGDLTLTGDTSLPNASATLFNLAPQTAISVTMNGWLTPTGTFQPIQSAGAVSINGGTNIADGAAGDLLILVNIGAQTITFTETTGLISAGNIVLGAGDAATLIYHGASWIQVSSSNN